MKDIEFKFTLTDEEADALGSHLHDYFGKGMMAIQKSMVLNKDDSETAKMEIEWLIRNMEWFCTIVKKVGFRTASTEENLKKTREIHNLTVVEGDNKVAP